MRSLGKSLVCGLVGFGLLVSVAGIAAADDVKNNVDATNGTFVAGDSTNIKVWLDAGKDSNEPNSGPAICNVSTANPATFLISSNPPGLTPNPTTITFTGCTTGASTGQTIGFTSATPTTYAVTLTQTTSVANIAVKPIEIVVTAGDPDPDPDVTPPQVTITTPADGATYFLDEEVLADYECTDDVAVATCVGDVDHGSAIDTASVGTKSFTVDAEDTSGNTASETVTYSVIYDFKGFFAPIDNAPTVNSIKAGSAVPVKFSLTGDQGLSILATGFPASKKVDCNPSAAVDAVESTVTAGSSSLSYDGMTDRYNYVWKTDKAWAGTCRVLQVKLIDGQSYFAYFKLTK